MPKKPTSRRLDDLFEGIQDEQARPPDKTKRKTSTRAGEKKPAISSANPAATKPAVRASALSQTKSLPPLESVSVAQRGGAGTPSSLSLAFQMDSRNWATLQVVDDEAVARDWNPDEQLLVKQVVDQLSQALENARLFQETRSRAEELSVLNEMGRELTTLFNIEAIAETIYKYASRLMDTTNLFVTLYDETKQEITPFYVISNRERITVPARKLGNSLTDYVLRTRKPLFIPENLLTSVKELGIDVVKFGNNNLAQCWMGAPLLVGETVLGTVGVQNLDSPNIFTERHRDLLTAISSQAAIAIQNARLFEETQNRTKELDALNQLNQRLSAQLNVDQVLQEIYHGAENLIDAKNFYIGLYSPEKNETSFPLNVSESVVDKTIVTLPADKGLTGYVLRVRKPILIPENVSEAMQKMGIERVGEPAKCWLGVPLLLGEQIIGVMAVQSYTEANAYDEHDRDLLMAVAGQAAISIQNARLFGETQRRVTELSTFNEISRELASALLRPEELYRLVHQQMSRLFDTTSFFIGTYETGSDHWEMAYQIENGQPVEILGPRDLKAGLGSYMIKTRQPLLIHSTQELEDFHQSQGIPQIGMAGSKSWIGVPLIATGQVVGVMAIQNYQQENLFSNQDLALFSTIAAQVAIALQNARLFQDTKRRAEEMATLNDLGRALTSQLNLNQVLDEVHKGVSRILDTTNFYIAIYDEPSQEIIFPYNVSESQVDREITRLPVDQGLTSYLIRNRESILLKGEASEWLADHGIESVGEPSQCWLGVPLLIGEQTLGAIAVQNYTDPDAFSEHDRYLLTAISNQAAIAIQNARLFEETQRRSHEISTLAEITSTASQSLDLKNLLGDVLRKVFAALQFEAGLVTIFNQKRTKLERAVRIGLPGDAPMDPAEGLEGSLCEYVYKTGQIMAISNLRKGAPVDVDAIIEEGFLGYLGIPLNVKGTIIGTLCVFRRNTNPIPENTVTLGQSIGNQIGFAIENARLFETEQARREEAETLYNASRAIAAAQNEEEIFTGVVENLDHTNVDRILIAMAEEYSGELWAQVKGVWDRDGNEALYIGNRYSAKQIPAMIRTFAGEIVRVEDFNTSTEIDEVTRSTYQSLNIKSGLVIPIRGQTSQGWFQLLTTSAPHTFRDEDIRSYLTLAQQIAIALESRQNAAGLALVNRIVSALTMATSLEDSLSIVVHEIVEGFPVVRGAITLLDEDKQGFTVIADHSKLENSPSVVGLKIPLEGNIATQTLVSTCKPYIVEDASNNPVNPPALQEEARRIGINYTAIFPISQNNEVIGTLGVDIAAENAILNKKQISLLEAALSPISASIERLRAEELLARSETDLRALFASMHDVIIVYDNQGRYVRIAPTNPERLIRPPDELIGKTIYEAVPAGLHQPFMEAIQRALGGEQDVRLEYPLRIEEQEYWFEASVSPLNSTEVFWVARDITGRKRVEEVLRASEDRFRSILDNIEDGYYEVDTAGNLTFFNPALVRLLGRPANELIGLNNRMFMPASGVKSVFQTYNRVFKTGIPEQAFNWDVMRPDGTLRAVEASVSPIKVADGSIAGFRGTVRDVTDRKKSEETLRRSNEYLSATAEIGQLVTSTLDMPTLFSRTVNLVRDRFRFYHASIFVTEETGFRTILQAATGEAGTEMIRQKHSLQVGSKSIVGEVAESGHAIIVNDTVASETHKFNPLLPETRAETAIPLRVGTRTIGVLDIQSTSPNAFSEDDIAVLQILADQVAIAIDNARSYELSMQAVKEMREADRLKSQFLANMSHELRTPLNSIIGFSRVILKGIDGAITDLQQQDLLAIHNSGQHLLGLINDILDLSRIEAGKMELTFDEVNLPDLITSVMSTVSGLVKDKHITLHRNLPANLPSVRADVMRIRQVLINLLSNAAKFTDEGTITVQASVVDNPTGHPEITISVTDTGPGISQEDQKKLFQPFSQVDASPTRKSGGSGLGLSISNHLIQMHGGHIGVESTPEKGSTFYFTLPAFRGKPETDAPQGKRIILAIDDDPQVISLYERYLQPQGYQVVSLSDPSRAAERVRQLKPFAVTLDIMMPGYDGWHVLNDLKSNPETRDVPVIVCSIVEEQEKGFNLGAADYLVKPILEDEILNALDRLNINGNIREVLIVDDDPNDLRLMGRMLSEQGRYQPMLAEGGRAGWESIQARTPHAVILDLFMPELDGFTILERMRSAEKLRDIPVIVVSGGGLTSEQEQQLQDFGQRMIQKSALTGKQLVEMLEHTLQQVKK